MLENRHPKTEKIKGKPFPYPLCKRALPVGISVKHKPYCVCNDCGIQLFFRGKVGIQRLEVLLETARPMTAEFSSAPVAVALYNRLEELRKQKGQLEARQGIIFRNQTLDDAIAVLDGEIQRIEAAIRKARKEAEKKK